MPTAAATLLDAGVHTDKAILDMPSEATCSIGASPELVHHRGAAVDVVDVNSLAARAAAVAADQGAPLTRQTYASVYRAFCVFVGPDASADALTAERVRPVATSSNAPDDRRRRRGSRRP
jgi:hypothetical protein